MSDYVFAPPPAPSAAVANTEARFPVRRIFCVGRNYAEHTREMGHDPDREPPFFFGKPPSEIAHQGEEIAFPPETDDLHYEGEMVVALGSGGRDIAQEDARSHIWGYAIGNDLTRRDLQKQAKDLRRPWDMAKGFDASAPIGPVHPVETVGHLKSGVICLSVDGETRQKADLSEMIWPVPDVISFLSNLVRLEPGDLIMTGTPAGVGAIEPGQTCIVEIEGLGRLSTPIVA
jgi:fumarylpyruvate hydrolase